MKWYIVRLQVIFIIINIKISGLLSGQRHQISKCDCWLDYSSQVEKQTHDLISNKNKTTFLMAPVIQPKLIFPLLWFIRELSCYLRVTTKRFLDNRFYSLN